MGTRIEDGRNPRLPIQSAELNVLFEARDRIASTYKSTKQGIVVVVLTDVIDPATHRFWPADDLRARFTALGCAPRQG
jgi:hypothetical protein